MLRYALFAPDTAIAFGLERCESLLLLRAFDHFLPPEGLLDYVRAYSPQVLFFDISEGREGLYEAAELLRGSTHTHLVAVARDLDPEVLIELMNLGVREFLRFPFDPDKLMASMARIEHIVASAPAERESTDLLFSFLPAKPGVGASTTAIHTALELAQRPHSRVLLTDFDLNCGLSRFLLKLGNPLGVRDAVAKMSEMDDGLWMEIKSSVEDLDILPSCLIEASLELEPMRVRNLFEFARRRYRIVLADLSGMMENFSLDILQQSRRILLVVEPELAGVHMAREKMRFLDAHELQDRVALVINRWRKDAPLTISDIESVLGVPAEITLSDSPEQVYKSVMRGGALDPSSAYYREIADLASWLASESGVKRGPKPKRKVEYFSLIPSRYSLNRA
ncbi:MAG: AAA family ATPase [Acidobacteria bacterium]|nr:AAA family ATPase [Acidobacteriota bacterium]